MNSTQDFCRYVDVFYGSGQTDHFPETGLASKWFYIKALCGNTVPHAALPFGRMTVGPYSGGYPTGYGTHWPNSCGGIRKLGDTMTVRGFSHLHQSGTGAIDYYYNYAIVTPFYGSVSRIAEFHPLDGESARPGLYETGLNGVLCRLTVSGAVALHSYRYFKPDGRAAVDFSNDGLSPVFGDQFHGVVKDASVSLVPGGGVTFSGLLSGIRMHFCVLPRTSGVTARLFAGETELTGDRLTDADTSKPFGAVFDFDGGALELAVSYSTVSPEAARRQAASATAPFDAAANEAYALWNERLSAVRIDTDDRVLREKFYSNLYHSLFKPCDLTGETVQGVSENTVSGFATFWDQYKTALPLVYALYPDMGRKIAQGIVSLSRTQGHIPCSFGLTDMRPCENQARMLGVITLCDAFYCGLASKGEVAECVRRELEQDIYRPFLENGLFERYTHVLDTADACRDAAAVVDDPGLKSTLLKLAENWKNVYAEDGLLSENSPYYEGDRFNYSFRLHKNMDERIALCGGKDAFVKKLDAFFGFGMESVRAITTVKECWREIGETAARVHRFEGFNNESDMETPYAYVAADRHDRLCDIVHEAVNVTFATGRGGLPGNNDSGGLSSCFVWNALGLFPAAGTGEFYVGTPAFDRAEMTLSSGKTLVIRARRPSKDAFRVRSAAFNGRSLPDFRIPVREVMAGGTLEFVIE